MKKIINELLNLIKYEYLEKLSFVLLMLWIISPIMEYIFKNYLSSFYTYYFIFTIYFVGIFGIFLYIVYFIKLYKDKKVERKKFIPQILIIILLIISIISSILSENTYLSIFGESYRKEGLVGYTMYIGFVLLASIMMNKKHIKYIANAMIIVCFIITTIPLFRSDFTYLNFTNVFHNLNHYAYYLMINIMLSAIMFITDKKIIKKVLYLLFYIFLIYLLIRNDTFGSYLAIFITLIVLFIYTLVKKYQRLNVILLILAFIITSFGVSHFDIKIGERINFESTKGTIITNILSLTRDIKGFINRDEEVINHAGSMRGALWKGAWDYTKEHPLFGGGMESVGIYYIDNNIGNSDRPHNMVLQTSSFIGIPGAIIYVILILYIAITNLKVIKKDSTRILIYFTAMCYFISSMFGNSMYYTSPYFAILLGLLIGFNQTKDKKLD